MHKTLSRLAATTTLVVIGLGTMLVAPASAATATASPSTSSTSAVGEPGNRTVVVEATSVEGARSGVSDALASNGAADAWPKVDADLTPQLESAAANRGGTAFTQIIGLPFKITIHCEITFPPFKIKCTIDITF